MGGVGGRKALSGEFLESGLLAVKNKGFIDKKYRKGINWVKTYQELTGLYPFGGG